MDRSEDYESSDTGSNPVGRIAPVAQGTEHEISTLGVRGSNPLRRFYSKFILL